MTDEGISKEGLRVAIGFPSAVMLVIGGIVGVGIFVNPAVVARSLHSPALALTAWALGGGLAILGAFVYAELAARIPETGGEYVYLSKTYGPLAGFMYGWTTLLVVQTGGMAAVAIIFAKNLNFLAGGALNDNMIVVGVLVILAGVNCLGVKSGNGVQAILGLLKVGAIAALVIAGLFVARSGGWRTAHIEAATPADFLKSVRRRHDPGGVQLRRLADRQLRRRRDRRTRRATSRRALVVGVLGVITLYILVNLACLRALGIDSLGATLTPAADVLRVAAGPHRRNSRGRRHRALRPRLHQPVDSHRPPRLLRHGPRRFVLPQVAEISREQPRAGDRHRAAGGLDRHAGAFRQLRADPELCHRDELPVLRPQRVLPVRAAPARRRRGSGADRFRRTVASRHHRPLHRWRCVVIVGCSFWAYPINSLIGYGIMLVGIPPYLILAPPRHGAHRRASAMTRAQVRQSDYMHFAKFGSRRAVTIWPPAAWPTADLADLGSTWTIWRCTAPTPAAIGRWWRRSPAGSGSIRPAW